MNFGSIARLDAPRPATRSTGVRTFLALAFALVLVGSAPVAAQTMKDGKDALAQGRIDDAITAYRAVVAASPGDAQAHLGLGLALEKKRQWPAALESFQKASELDPRLADPLRGIGAMQLRLGKPAEAEASFRKATDIDRKFPEAQLGLGDALVDQKKIPEAIAVYEQGLKFGAKTAPMFQRGLGEAEAARDSMRAAEVWLITARQSAETMDPSVRGPIFRSLGDLYMQRKIPSLAIPAYQEAKTIDPNDLDTRMALGDAYYRGSLYNDALNEYKAVVDADPDYAEGWLKLGRLYYLASQSDPQRVFQSIEALDKLLVLEPNNLEGKALLAQAHFRKGGTAGRAEAKRLLDEIRATGQFPPEAWRTMGIIQYESREYQNAIDSFGKATKLETVDYMRVADSYRRLAAEQPDSLKKAGMYTAADSAYAEIIARDSTAADAKKAQFERGRMKYLAKDYAGAEEQLLKTIALDPKSAEAVYYLGLTKRGRGDDAGGKAEIQKALAMDPTRADWWLQLGGTHQKLKEDAEAQLAFQKAAELDTVGTVGAIARQQLGYAELLKKNWVRAAELLEESVRLDPKQVQSWIWLGQAQQNAGNRARAVECYRKVLELKPGEPNATKGLKALGL